MVRKIELNPKQKKFAELYVQYGNCTQAAKEAGYSEKTAHVQGCKLLKHSKVKEYVQQLSSLAERERIASAIEVMEYLTSVMRGEIDDQFGIEPSLADRTRAAQELGKRLFDKNPVEAKVTIVNDIPRPSKKES